MLYQKDIEMIKRHPITRDAVDAGEVLQKSLISQARLFDALEALVKAWDKIDGEVEIPDEINKSEIWDTAKEALASAKD